MFNTLLIFIGAGLGGVLRYWISNATYWLVGKNFPYGTLMVNVSGCFLMGILFVIIFDHFAQLSTSLRALLLIGLLGGYTTFSTFSIETIILFENGAYTLGLVNVLASIILCISATWLGVIGGRQL